jgi:hypothetical protein
VIWFPDELAREQLTASQLADFEALWSLSTDWHEAPNERRGGWSGVSRHVLDDGSAIFLKRQENHLCRTLRHPWRGIPTFYREYLNILRLQCARGRRRRGALLRRPARKRTLACDSGDARARRLHEPRRVECRGHASAPASQRQSLITATAQACARLHHHGLQHSCLYGKHVFVRCTADIGNTYQESDVRFIDLEKLRRGISRERVSASMISTN